LFLRISIPAVDSTHNSFPLATSLFHRPCAKPALHTYRFRRLTESPAAFLMCGVAFITSNDTSYFTRSGHGVCIASLKTRAIVVRFTADISWHNTRNYFSESVRSFFKPSNNICNLPCTCISCFVYRRPNVLFPPQQSKFLQCFFVTLR
jgi:hypothetical protein